MNVLLALLLGLTDAQHIIPHYSKSEPKSEDTERNRTAAETKRQRKREKTLKNVS